MPARLSLSPRPGYAVYVYTQLAIGGEFATQPGNSERFFPLFLAAFLLGGAAFVTARNAIEQRKLPEPSTAMRRTASTVLFLLAPLPDSYGTVSGEPGPVQPCLSADDPRGATVTVEPRGESNQPLSLGGSSGRECHAGSAAMHRIATHGGFTIRRFIALALPVMLVLVGCGGGEMSLTEYVDRINAIFERGIEQYEPLATSPEGLVLIVGQGSHLGITDQGVQLTDFTPRDLQVALERVAEIQDEALEAAADIDPPEQIADLHRLFFRELPIAELAVRAGTAANWYELSESDEMAAYRAALAADNQVCAEFQVTLDATAARGVFADTPWIPGELKETVNYALGCDSLPAHPEDAYRPPPTSVSGASGG